MSYNGSGTFQINTTGQPVVTGTVISSTAFNALTADLATGLSTAITKDGQTATTARIPFAAGISSTLVTDSSSTSTGSIITAGGIGVAKALYVGTTANVAGAATLSSTLTYGGITLTNAVTGTGKMVLDTSPTLVTPALGTPASGVLTNCTGVQYTGFKNRIINGSMVIDQRNAGASVTLSSPTAVYTIDRWKASNVSDGVFTIQQSSTVPAGFTKSLVFTTTTADASLAAGQYAYIEQGIEGFNVADFGWGASGAQTVTVSFWVRSSLTGTFGGALTNGTATRSYPFNYTINSANTWEQKTVTVAGDTTGTWATDNSLGVTVRLGLGVGSTYSGTAGAWAAGNLIAPTGAVSVIGTNTATFYITGVQLEKGSTATSFDYRPYGTELALCQRYLPAFRYDTSNTMLPSQLQFNSTTAGRGMIVFPVPTRTTVTGATISSAAHFTCFDSAGTNTVASAMAISTGGTNGTLFDANVASGGTTNRSYTLGITNSAGYIYFTGAEL